MKAACALLALIGAVTPASAQQRVQERVAAPANGVVEIHNVGGTLRIVGTGRNEVGVEGTISPAEARLDLRRDGARTVVRVVLPRGMHRRAGGELLVRVPRGSSVIAHTVTAPIEVSGVRGQLLLKSVQGSIRAADAQSRLLAETVAGDIVVIGARDTVRAKTMSGSLTVERPTGSLELSSISGGVTVADAETVTGVIRSVTGLIEFAGTTDPASPIHFTNVSGDTQLRLARSASTSFQVRSLSGEIENDFGAVAVRRSRYAPGKELTFSTGSGRTAVVVVHTTSGNVRIKKP